MCIYLYLSIQKDYCLKNYSSVIRYKIEKGLHDLTPFFIGLHKVFRLLDPIGYIFLNDF